MKSLLPIFAALLALSLSSFAAIVVTLSPTAEGTRFEIVQSSPNPVISLNQVTVGVVPGFLLPSASLRQEGGSILNETAVFLPALGTITDVRTGTSSELTEFFFVFDGSENMWRPLIYLDDPFTLDSGQSHEMEFTNPLAAEVSSVTFSQFIPGRYVYQDVLWGEVTTVVVPEPSSAALLLATALVLLKRRNRHR